MQRNRLLFLRLTSKMKSIRLKTMSRNRTGLSLRDEISHDPDTSAHDRKLSAAKQEGRRRAAPARLKRMSDRRGIVEMSWQDKLDARTKLDRILNSDDVKLQRHLFDEIMGSPSPIPVHCVRTSGTTGTDEA